MSQNSEDVVYAMFLVYGITFAVALVVGLIGYVLTSIPLAEIFAQAGIEKWKAWVPFYNTFIWLQLGGQNGWWTLGSLVSGGSIVTAVFLYMGMYRQGIAYGKDGSFVVLGIFLPIVWLFMLAYAKESYQPQRIAAAGLGGPLVGYGAVVPAGLS